MRCWRTARCSDAREGAPRSPSNHAQASQLHDRQLNGLLWGNFAAAQVHVGAIGRLIRRGYARKIGDQAVTRLLIQALGSRCSQISSGVSIKTSINSPFFEEFPRHPPLCFERRNKRGEHDQPRVDHQSRAMSRSADVLDAIHFRKPQVAIQSMADIISVEEYVCRPMANSRPSSMFATVDLPEPESPVNHKQHGRLPHELCTLALGHIGSMPSNVGCPPKSEPDETGGHCPACQPCPQG